MLSVRYPAHEVEVLDQVAESRGLTRGAFIYLTVSREVARELRKRQRLDAPQDEMKAAS